MDQKLTVDLVLPYKEDIMVCMSLQNSWGVVSEIHKSLFVACEIRQTVTRLQLIKYLAIFHAN